MQDAKKKGYTTMKLYTSDHPQEQAAQGLYEKLGFVVTRVQEVTVAGQTFHLLYRERQL